MALRVWLPLNGNLNNQGLSGVQVTNTGATISNEGKIGKAYLFGTSSSYLTLPADTIKNFTECSVSLWLKIISWNTNYATYMQIGESGYAWKNYIFGILRDNATSKICFTLANGTNSTSNSYKTPDLSLNTWYHLTFTYGNGNYAIYVNGNLYAEGTSTVVPDFSKVTKITIGTSNITALYQTNCLMNDIRIYDECLSPKQIKEISKGLVAHYKLDNNLQVPNNCYSKPTFNTSDSNGGWNHWGQSGASGTYGQNTNVKYIFRSSLSSYSHWVANASGATGSYLLYLSPAFDGGIRSLYCILKEENSAVITNNICYPAWNGRNGGVENNSWTSIEYLNNGFYLCKCEGISQDGSNNLVGIYIKPGYKVYFSECYLENDRQYCSDFLTFNKPNIFKAFKAGGQTSVSGENVTTSGTDADTYFYIQTTEPLITGKRYTIQLNVSGLTTLTWTFGVGSQSSTSAMHLGFWKLVNGLNSFTFVCPSSLEGATQIILDDSARATGAPIITISKPYYCEDNYIITEQSGFCAQSIFYGNFKYNKISKKYEGCVEVVNDATDNKYLNVSGIQASLELATPTAITFNWWGKHSFGLAESGIFSTSSSTYPTDYLTTLVNQYDHNFRFNNSEGTGVSVSASNLIIQNEWHMYTLTYDGTNIKSYRDGVLQQTVALVGPLASFNKIFLYLSAAGGAYRKASGCISDFRIYATALSANEILTMYKNSGIIDNKGNTYTYEFQENEKNMMWYINNAIIDKTYKDGLASYTQTNCQVTLTDDGYRVYRPPNLLYSEAKNTMWGGLKININNANHKDHVRENLQTGHKYIILYDVKGQTSKAQTSIGWTNLMGWGGGGLNPTPSNAQYRAIPANFESNEWQTFFYKWDLTDDVYKVCTQSYSSFVKGNTYLSYADFQIGWTYEDTGTLGTDVYIKNIRMYDITDMAKPKLMKTGVFNIDEIHENNKTKVRQNEIEANSFIEI